MNNKEKDGKGIVPKEWCLLRFTFSEEVVDHKTKDARRVTTALSLQNECFAQKHHVLSTEHDCVRHKIFKTPGN